ncbi:hypothetical protein BT96DRAFT_1003444 [Gymnopus androsaceus JB14]|uniref:Ribonuclease H1 N-terminal domain-containing protein n=1 Tax=Gymnopus androsaceus JB14 TaxID=1447944 RepID=A0A6A4GU45_9AGAR|nr:hypothetical protein BT96DRAFT_1003444 [Gymnopus androsaceus JB14]
MPQTKSLAALPGDLYISCFHPGKRSFSNHQYRACFSSCTRTPRSSASTSSSPASPRTPRTPNPPSPPPASPRTPRTANALPTSPIPSRGSIQTPGHPASPSTPSWSCRQAPALPHSPSLSSALSVSNSLAGETIHPAIPHPQDLVQPQRVNGSKFYVVFAGTQVGIFGNWYGQAKVYTHGISGSHQRSYSHWNEAREAYTDAYLGRAGAPPLTILDTTDNLEESLSGLEIM